MKRKLIILFILFLNSIFFRLYAQDMLPLFSKEYFISNSSIGLKIGLNRTYMKYTDDLYADYKLSPTWTKLFGIAGDFKINERLSFKPDMIFIGKGLTIEDDIDYKINSKYFELGLPFAYHLKPFSQIQPYLLVGTYLGVVRKGTIEYNNDEIDINTANIKGTDIGLRLGIGGKYELQTPKTNLILCAEIAYDYGFADTWSKMEHNREAIGLNMEPYKIIGKRKNRGIQVSFSLLIPLNALKKQEEPEIVLVEEVIEEVVIIEEVKPCYSIEEINQMIVEGKSITDKKICMMNINFETNKAIIKEGSKQFLDGVVIMLENNPSMQLKINGHTDSEGSDEYNLELSKKRAQAVVNYLILKGIRQDRLQSEGFGETKPIDTNETEEGRLKNRRVEFEIINE